MKYKKNIITEKINVGIAMMRGKRELKIASKRNL